MSELRCPLCNKPDGVGPEYCMCAYEELQAALRERGSYAVEIHGLAKRLLDVLDVTPMRMDAATYPALCAAENLLRAALAKNPPQGIAAPDTAQGMDRADSGDPLKAMVDRFLGWKLPADFGPDAGISFTPSPHPHGWPVGTNLFTADQARTMLEAIAGPELARLKADCEQGWKNYYRTRKELAEIKYPGMTNKVHANYVHSQNHAPTTYYWHERPAGDRGHEIDPAPAMCAYLACPTPNRCGLDGFNCQARRKSGVEGEVSGSGEGHAIGVHQEKP